MGSGRPGESEGSLDGRAGQMARSLASTARSHGLQEDEVGALAGAHSLAMSPRVDLLEDDHHPAYLHPGRSALILLRDVGPVDVSILVVAALHESLDAELRVGPEAIEEHIGEAALQALASIPRPGDERLVERLLSLGPGLSLAALAERLDHLRHLHVRDDLMGLWADSYDEVLEVWLPFARRVHPKLAVRYAHWARTFVKRI